MDFQQERTQQILFPNATPFSLDNFENKSSKSSQSSKEGLSLENDEELNKAMSSLMTEYAKDTAADKGAKKKQEGMLTGTSLNLNLLQGDLVNYGRYDLNKNPIQPFTDRIQETLSSSGVVSYKEGLTNDVPTTSSTVGTTTSGTTSAGKSQKLLDLEKKLSELTTEYTTQYRLYTEDLLTRSRFLQTNSQYLNKLVRDMSYTGSDASAAFYYVNQFGYTHRYKDLSSVMLYDDKTCPAIARSDALASDDKMNPYKITPASFVDISSGSINGGFSKFSDLASYDMTGYTPCITTRNVKLPGASSSEDKYAWVDAEGKKHVYEAGVWPDKRHSSCLTSVVGEPITLTANQYNSIPTAEDATIIQRDKTFAEKWGSLDDDILAQIKKLLGNYYYPAVYVFWCFIILVAVLMIFKFAFLCVSPGGGGDNGNGGGEGNENGGGVSLLGIVIMVLIVIFAVYYYFSYTYNLDVGITRNDTDTVYTLV